MVINCLLFSDDGGGAPLYTHATHSVSHGGGVLCGGTYIYLCALSFSCDDGVCPSRHNAHEHCHDEHVLLLRRLRTERKAGLLEQLLRRLI